MLTVTALVLATVLPQGPQSIRDTLVYNLALVTIAPHVQVEARLTNFSGAPVILAAPPTSRSAGTIVETIAATDDRGVPLTVTSGSEGRSWTIQPRGAGAIRFRYRVNFHDAVAAGSTGSGFDSLRMYATTGSLFVAPDRVMMRKSSREYPVVEIEVLPPAGWEVISGFARDGAVLEPKDGDDLVGGTIAAAPDFRLYRDSVDGTPVTLAIRGHRYFSDTDLKQVIDASLEKGSQTLGRIPVPQVTYTSDLGRKGRTSGSLQGVASIGLIWEPGELLDRSRAHDTFHETLHLWFGGVMETERWWIEGVDDYYAARLLAAWHNDPADLAALCWESWDNYENIPHRLRMTMTQEAHQGMVGDNTELLVYRKGMLAGLLLDAAIRRSTNGHATLDEVAHRVLAIGKERRSHYVNEAELRDAVRAAGGSGAMRVWDRVVAGTSEIDAEDVQDALRTITGRDFPEPVRQKQIKSLLHT